MSNVTKFPGNNNNKKKSNAAVNKAKDGAEHPQPWPPEKTDNPNELLDLETSDVRDLVKALYNTFVQFVGDVSTWLGNADKAITNYHIRLQVMEALFTEPSLKQYRDRFVGLQKDINGDPWPLTFNDFRDIVENYVHPKLAELAAQRAAQQQQQQQGCGSNCDTGCGSGCSTSPIVGPDGNPITHTGLVTADGRPIVVEEND